MAVGAPGGAGSQAKEVAEGGKYWWNSHVGFRMNDGAFRERGKSGDQDWRLQASPQTETRAQPANFAPLAPSFDHSLPPATLLRLSTTFSFKMASRPVVQVRSLEGESTSTLPLPAVFTAPIRNDVSRTRLRLVGLAPR